MVSAALAHDVRQGTSNLDRRGRNRILARVGDTDSATQGTDSTTVPEATEPSQSGTGDTQSSETTNSSN